MEERRRTTVGSVATSALMAEALSTLYHQAPWLYTYASQLPQILRDAPRLEYDPKNHLLLLRGQQTEEYIPLLSETFLREEVESITSDVAWEIGVSRLPGLSPTLSSLLSALGSAGTKETLRVGAPRLAPSLRQAAEDLFWAQVAEASLEFALLLKKKDQQDTPDKGEESTSAPVEPLLPPLRPREVSPATLFYEESLAQKPTAAIAGGGMGFPPPFIAMRYLSDLKFDLKEQEEQEKEEMTITEPTGPLVNALIQVWLSPPFKHLWVTLREPTLISSRKETGENIGEEPISWQWEEWEEWMEEYLPLWSQFGVFSALLGNAVFSRPRRRAPNPYNPLDLLQRHIRWERYREPEPYLPYDPLQDIGIWGKPRVLDSYVSYRTSISYTPLQDLGFRPSSWGLDLYTSRHYIIRSSTSFVRPRWNFTTSWSPVRTWYDSWYDSYPLILNI